jgi:hypothetical protein
MWRLCPPPLVSRSLSHVAPVAASLERPSCDAIIGLGGVNQYHRRNLPPSLREVPITNSKSRSSTSPQHSSAANSPSSASSTHDHQTNADTARITIDASNSSTSLSQAPAAGAFMFYLSLLSEVLRAGRPKKDTKKKEFRKPKGNSKEFFERRYGVGQKSKSMSERKNNEGSDTISSSNTNIGSSNSGDTSDAGVDSTRARFGDKTEGSVSERGVSKTSDKDITTVLEHAAGLSKRLTKRLKREAKKEYEISGAKYNDRVLKVVSSKKIDLAAAPEELARDVIKTITRRVPSFGDKESLLLLQLLAKKSTGESVIFKFVDRFKRLDEKRGGKQNVNGCEFGKPNSFKTFNSMSSKRREENLAEDREILNSRNVRGDCYFEIRKLATTAWENVEEWEVRL